MDTDEELYEELLFYTLSHPDSSFIHQHAVDAYGAQHATETSKPISVAFSLIGLYLAVQKGLPGRDVQRAHTRLAKSRRQWPTFPMPRERGSVTVRDVMAEPAGAARDRVIRLWCEDVWRSWQQADDQIAKLADLASQSTGRSRHVGTRN